MVSLTYANLTKKVELQENTIPKWKQDAEDVRKKWFEDNKNRPSR